MCTCRCSSSSIHHKNCHPERNLPRPHRGRCSRRTCVCTCCYSSAPIHHKICHPERSRRSTLAAPTLFKASYSSACTLLPPGLLHHQRQIHRPHQPRTHRRNHNRRTSRRCRRCRSRRRSRCPGPRNQPPRPTPNRHQQTAHHSKPHQPSPSPAKESQREHERDPHTLTPPPHGPR